MLLSGWSAKYISKYSPSGANSDVLQFPITFGSAEVCPYGSTQTLDDANQEAFEVDIIDEDNDSQVLGDTPVTLGPDTKITIEPSSLVEPEIFVMDLEITVEDVTSVIFVFYDTDGIEVDRVEVSSYFLSLLLLLKCL